MSGKLTEAQRKVLACLSRLDRRAETNAVSIKCGHGYGPWAGPKLAALAERGLVHRFPPDRATLTCWQITPAGRLALSSNPQEASDG